MPEQHRYLRGLRTWVGFRQIGIPMERSAPHAGRTKYSPLKLLKLRIGRDFCFFHRACSHSGSLGGGCNWHFFPVCPLFSYTKFRMHSPQGFTALILAIMFFSGLNLFFLGIIGEYVGRVYEEREGPSALSGCSK